MLSVNNVPSAALLLQQYWAVDAPEADHHGHVPEQEKEGGMPMAPKDLRILA